MKGFTFLYLLKVMHVHRSSPLLTHITFKCGIIFCMVSHLNGFKLEFTLKKKFYSLFYFRIITRKNGMYLVFLDL